VRHSRTRLALATLAAFAVGVPSAQAVRPTLTPGGVSAFGNTSFLLTLPHGARVPGDATLTENGRELDDVSVTPAASVPGSYGVVLVIDGSSRRAGRAIEGQLTAARELIKGRPAGMPMAVVTYNAAATVVAPFTTEQTALEQALAKAPPLARGSHVYDAVDAAVKLFTVERLTGGAVVALAGQADDGSALPPAQVAKHAYRGGVWIFGASLAAGDPTGAKAIDALAQDGVGQNLGEMSGPGLVALLRSIGEQTGNATVLSYRSPSQPGSHVSVEFQATTQAVRASTLLPRRTGTVAVAGHRRSRPDVHTSFLNTPAGRGVISAAVVILLFGGFAPVLMSMRKRKDMRSRVESYASEAPSITASQIDLAMGRAAIRDHQLLGGDRMRRLADTLEIARLDVTPGQLVLRTVVVAAVLGFIVGRLSGIPLAGVLMVIGVPALVRILVKAKLARQRKLFADQLADALQAAASALRGGHSFVGALSTIVDEAPEPTATEFRRVVAAERIGIPLEQAFQDTIQRMNNRDVEQVALVALLQRETGGNAAEAVERVVENLRGRDDVRRLVNTLTSQGRMSRWVLTAIPVGLGIMLTTMNGDYMKPLFETGLGRVALGAAVLMCALGSMAIGKIVDIEV